MVRDSAGFCLASPVSHRGQNEPSSSATCSRRTVMCAPRKPSRRPRKQASSREERKSIRPERRNMQALSAKRGLKEDAEEASLEEDDFIMVSSGDGAADVYNSDRDDVEAVEGLEVGNDVADKLLESWGYRVRPVEEKETTEDKTASKLVAPADDDVGVPAVSIEPNGANSLNQVPIQLRLEFERNGHVALRDLLPATTMKGLIDSAERAVVEDSVSAYRQKVRVLLGAEKAELVESKADGERLLSEMDTPVPFLQFFNLRDKYKAIYDIVLSEHLGRMAADLLGVDSVRLYQDSLFWKRPGDGPTPFHADLSMMPLDTNYAVTFFIPLRALPGGRHAPSLQFASGSHRDFALGYWYDLRSTEGAFSYSGDLSARYPTTSHGRMALGDATAHHGFTLHWSPGIPSESRGRLALSVCYIAADARVLPKAQQRSMETEDMESYGHWLRKSKAGKPVKSGCLPVVFTR